MTGFDFYVLCTFIAACTGHVTTAWICIVLALLAAAAKGAK